MGSKLARTGVLLLVAAAGALSVLTTGTPALAHNPLTASDPRDGARIARAPSSVRLTFLSRVDPGTTTVSVTDPAGAPAAGGSPSIAGNKISVPLRAGAAGVYTVAWQMVAADGDKVGGRIRFTLTIPATVPTPTAPSAATAPTPTAPASTSGPAAPGIFPWLSPVPERPASSTQRGGWGRWIIFGAMLASVLALAGTLAARRARRLRQ